MGLKYMTCFVHSVNGQPVEIRQDGCDGKLARVFCKDQTDGHLSFYVCFLKEDGALIPDQYLVRFDEERQGYVDLDSPLLVPA